MTDRRYESSDESPKNEIARRHDNDDFSLIETATKILRTTVIMILLNREIDHLEVRDQVTDTPRFSTLIE